MPALRTARALIVGLLAVVLVTSILGDSPQAAASPRTPAPDATSRYRAVTLSKTQWQAAGYVTKARNQAISAGGSTMDYKKVKSIFGSRKLQVDWRRQMAAGFRQAGGRIKNISSAENRKVEAMRKKIYGKRRPLSDSVMQVLLDKAPSCKGKSGRVVVNKHEAHTYFNSCQTDDILYAFGGCIASMAAAAKWTKKDPRLNIPRWLIGAFCTLQGGIIKRAQGQSDVRAIYVRMYEQETYVPYPGGLRYYIQYTIRPQ